MEPEGSLLLDVVVVVAIVVTLAALIVAGLFALLLVGTLVEGVGSWLTAR